MWPQNVIFLWLDFGLALFHLILLCLVSVPLLFIVNFVFHDLASYLAFWVPLFYEKGALRIQSFVKSSCSTVWCQQIRKKEEKNSRPKCGKSSVSCAFWRAFQCFWWNILAFFQNNKMKKWIQLSHLVIKLSLAQNLVTNCNRWHDSNKISFQALSKLTRYFLLKSLKLKCNFPFLLWIMFLSVAEHSLFLVSFL